MAPTLLEHLVRTKVLVPAIDAPRRGMSREFDFRNLIAIAVLHRAHRLQINGKGLRAMAECVASARVSQLKSDSVMWYGFEPDFHRYRADSVPTQPTAVITNAADVEGYLATGYFGTTIGLREIVASLQEATGDELL
jgi:hypothetical protein